MPDLYSDPLVRITDEGIRVANASLFRDDRTIPWSDIEKIRAVLPTVWNGRWRITGTADFRTWMATDWDRPGRETIFILHRHHTWSRLGFTAHDAERVKEILQHKGVLIDEQGDALPTPPPKEDRPLWRWGSFQATTLLLAALISYVGWRYPQLPPQVATHFNAAGNADAWGPKSTLVTVMIFAACFLSCLFIVLGYAISHRSSAILGRWMLWLGAATVAMLTVLSHLTIRANLAPSQSMGRAPLWLTAAYFAALITLIALMLRARQRGEKWHGPRSPPGRI